MELAVGDILEGKVTGITSFGAFVEVEPGKSGLVHISEVSNTYVNDINEFLTVGQTVKVKVIGLNENGRINLSIKKTEPKPQSVKQKQRSSRPQQSQPKEPQSFEDKLKQFMADSDSKISGIRQYSEHKTSTRKRK